VLSERPTEWRAGLNRWTRLNRKLKRTIEGALAPHRVDEYVIYQTIFGTWPLNGLATADRVAYTTRIQEYIVKVAREASRFTNWVNPDKDYETALNDFVAGLLDQRRSRAFLEDFEAFVERKVDGGLVNGLAQQVLKLTSPGVPDIYQGTESWDDSLVDPDNRRPVDYGARRETLAQSTHLSPADLFAHRSDGRIKLAVTARLLGLRRRHKAVFAEGDYVALQTDGPAAQHVVAYARRTDDDAVITIVPRLLTKLARAQAKDVTDPSIWAGTTLALPSGAWSDVLSGATFEDSEVVDLEQVFRKMPVSVLVQQHGS
jgi:(1->4)-alpha-D-glucan 1-alpha-D-glucosylmutase